VKKYKTGAAELKKNRTGAAELNVLIQQVLHDPDFNPDDVE
jgi:hypothetical protein